MSDGCFTCSGRCCYNIIVRVTPFDMWRIARAQELPLETFVEAWQETAPSEFGLRLDDTSDRYVPILRRHPVERAACTFLMHVTDDVKRCGVYPHRPLVCHVYPFEVHHGTVRIRDDARCGPSDWNLATLDYQARRDTATRYGAELGYAAGIAAEWNAGTPGGTRTDAFRRYVDFARTRCDELFAAGTVSAI